MRNQVCTILTSLVLGGYATVATAQNLPKTEFNVVAGVSSMNQYILGEKPFYEDTIIQNSNGAITVNVTPLDQLNIGGTEVMRLLNSGAIDIGTSAFAYFSSEVPMASGVDIPGLFATVDELRKGVDTYRSVIAKALEEGYNSKLLGVWGISNIVLFCRGDIQSMSDLEGLNIRSYGATLSSLIEGLGANPITIAFAEVVPALERGTIDCGATGVLSGNLAKWGEVSDTLYQLPIGPGDWFTAMNMDKWNSLTPEMQVFIEKEFAELEDKQWALANRETAEGLSCAAGKEPCTLGVLDDMKIVAFSPDDAAAFDQIVKTKVLPTWFELCGEDCTAQWHEIVGPLVYSK